MKQVFLLLWLPLVYVTAHGESAKEGAYLGAQASEIPSWFVESFLDFEEDVAEAAAENKRILLYFHQESCPYCAQMVKEVFEEPGLKSYLQQHFNSIHINMWGDREVVQIGGQNFTEKTFASALKVQYTPTIIFLNEQGKVAARLNGYYPPEHFRTVLQYVAEKREKNESLSDFMLASQLKKDSGKLISEPFYVTAGDLQQALPDSGFLAVYFELPDCDDCKILHEKVLVDPPTRALVEKMVNIQFNPASEQQVVTPTGKKISIREFASELGVSYTPTVIFFDETGQVVHKIEGFLKTFHFQSTYAYVLEKAYLNQPNFQRYIAERGDDLRAKGYDTDIWGYESDYPVLRD